MMQNQSQNTMLYRDPSSRGGDGTFQGQSIKIILPPKPGCEGDGYNMGGGNCGESRMDVCALTLSCLAQDPNLPSSKLPFAWKLYEMLETVHKNEVDTDIVSWVDDGHAFKVHDLKRFVDEIVPTYFKQSKYKSFQRQLYFYGFTREASSGKKGHTPGSYRHPMFVRGKKTLCLSMAPKKSKKRSGAKSPTTTAEVVRKVSGEAAQNNSVPSTTRDSNFHGTIPFPLHRGSSNDTSPLPLHNFTSTDTIPTSNVTQNRRHNMNPQMKFQQQQNNLQKLQMENFLRSLQQSGEQNVSVPPQKPTAPSQAPKLQPAASDGITCNMFGGTFHVVGRYKSRK